MGNDYPGSLSVVGVASERIVIGMEYKHAASEIQGKIASICPLEHIPFPEKILRNLFGDISEDECFQIQRG